MMVSMLMVAVVMHVLRLLMVAPISRPMLCKQMVRCQSTRYQSGARGRVMGQPSVNEPPIREQFVVRARSRWAAKLSLKRTYEQHVSSLKMRFMC